MGGCRRQPRQQVQREAERRLRVPRETDHDAVVLGPCAIGRDDAEHLLRDVRHPRECLHLRLGELGAAQDRGGDHLVRIANENRAHFARALHGRLQTLAEIHPANLMHQTFVPPSSVSCSRRPGRQDPCRSADRRQPLMAGMSAGKTPRSAKNSRTPIGTSDRARNAVSASTGIRSRVCRAVDRTSGSESSRRRMRIETCSRARGASAPAAAGA